MKTLTLITLVLLSSVTFAAVGESKKPPCEKHDQSNRQSKRSIDSKDNSKQLATRNVQVKSA